MHTQRNPSIDVLRGIAILLVLGAHFPCYEIWTRIGWTGVNLFFVLSGFLVSGLLFDSLRSSGWVQARRFFVRRGFKIWPSFYCFMAFYAFVALLKSGPYPWRAIIDAASFIQNYTSNSDEFLTSHIWSLCVEEHFYVLLPLLFLAAKYFLGSKTPRAIAIAAALSLPICFLLRLRVAQDGQGIHQSHLLFDTLLLGVLLSYLYRFQPEWFRLLRSTPFALVGVVCLAPMLLGIRDSRFVQTIGVTSGSIGFGLLLCWAVDRWPGNSLASSALRGLSRIGFYSYPIYLWHLMVRLVVLACFGSQLLGFWAYVAGSIAAGAMLTQLMEQPFLRIRDRLFPDQAVAFTPNSFTSTKGTVHDPVLVPVSRNASNPT